MKSYTLEKTLLVDFGCATMEHGLHLGRAEIFGGSDGGKYFVITYKPSKTLPPMDFRGQLKTEGILWCLYSTSYVQAANLEEAEKEVTEILKGEHPDPFLDDLIE